MASRLVGRSRKLRTCVACAVRYPGMVRIRLGERSGESDCRGKAMDMAEAMAVWPGSEEE